MSQYNFDFTPFDLFFIEFRWKTGQKMGNDKRFANLNEINSLAQPKKTTIIMGACIYLYVTLTHTTYDFTQIKSRKIVMTSAKMDQWKEYKSYL